MSDLLNQASLVMVPSGYKEDTVYSVVPSDGSGDLSFTRASNGTRINSAGLVEVCPWNLITYSEEFNNGGKTLVNTTIGVDVTTAPNGTTTADSLIENGANDLHAVYNFGALTYVAGVYNLSCYVKKGIRDWVRIQLYDGTNNQSVWANVNTGVLGLVVSPATATIESVGDGWYRISISTTMLSATGGWAIYSSTADAQFGGYQGTNGATALYLWGLQLNIGATAKPYFPTTDRLNVPRLTYQNGGGGCPSLLLEKQSTNVLLYSEQFDNGAWTLDGDGVGQSVTANYSISPDGTQNADRLQLNKTGGTYSRIRQDKSGAGTYAWTVYMKSNTSASQNVGLRLDSTGINCVVTTSWQRFTLNATVGTPQAQILLFDAISGNDETADISVWGAQLEASSYPTSYIPTTSSSATRVADACFKTGISSLIGQTEGVVFVDLVMKNDISSVNRVVSITESNWLSGGSIRIDIQSINIQAECVNNNGAVGGAGGNITITPNTRYKIAFAYKQNDLALYVNGTQLGTNTSTGAMPTCSELYLNELGGGFGGPYQPTEFNQAILFPTRLTNAQLASLTTI